MDGQMKEQLQKLASIGGGFESETDRGCAVLAVAALEERLRESLKERLSISDADLNSFVPMGAMGKGVQLAKMVGLIPPAWEADWKLTLKIRNEFAHSAAPSISFDAPPISHWIRDLAIIPRIPGHSNRAKFLSVASALYALLAWVTQNVGAISVPSISMWGPDGEVPQ